MAKTIGMALIARNSEATIKDCIESFIANVDECVVVFAGKSTDKTVTIVNRLKRKYPQIRTAHFKWVNDFSAARNYSFSMLNTDFLGWCDSDDVIYQPENLRSMVEKVDETVGGIWFPYHYAIDEYGNPTTIYERERLLRKKFGWIWKGRLHETVTPLQQCKFVRTDDVIIIHNHLSGQPRQERNMSLLDLMHKEDPEDKRVWLYLGHQHFAGGLWREAAQWYLKFGQDKGAMPLERWQALCYCSRALREMKDTQSIDVALAAVELYPNYRDGYLELAFSYADNNDYDKALYWSEIADLKDLVVEPPSIIFVNPLNHSFNRRILRAECFQRKGDVSKSIEELTQAYQVRPDSNIQSQIQSLQVQTLRGEIDRAIKLLSVHHLNNSEIAKLKSLEETAPFWYRDTDDFKKLQAGIAHYTSKIEDKPTITEGETTLVNIGLSLNPEKLLEEVDKEHSRVKVIAPFPGQGDIIRAYSHSDMEKLITKSPERHILNLQSDPMRIWCEYDKNIPDNLRIRLYVGKGLEHWTPKTITEVGCGGSETSAAWLARELSKKSCYPILYGMDNQVWNGVVYRKYETFEPDNMSCDLFISSRRPDVFYNPIPASQKWLWVHDIHCGPNLSPEVAEEIDAIICLSKWHLRYLKNTYPFLKDCEVIDLDNNDETYVDDVYGVRFHEDAVVNNLPKMVILGDAIDTERFDITEERISHRFIWVSSPDRGLKELLEMWPLIKKGLPDATLKIFYGWEYFDNVLSMPGMRDFKYDIVKLLKQDGVEWAGRVGQNQLAKELMQADMLLYPPHDFRETYGIAFLEAQAAGVLVFYRGNGALGETVKSGISLPLSATPEEIVSKIVDTLADEKQCSILRTSVRAYALARTWQAQAEKVLKLYGELDG